MIRLVRVELMRLRYRRAVLLLLIAALVIPAIILIATVYNTRPISEDEVQEVRTSFGDTKYFDQQVRQCERDPRNFGLGDATATEAADLCPLQVASQQYGLRSQLDLGEQLEQGTVYGVSTVLLLLMMLAGTTFVGHDWASGSMSNQLLFESRRSRVWAAKAWVVAGFAFVVSGGVSVAYWLVIAAVSSHRGLTSRSGIFGDGLEQAGRTALLVAAAAVGGYALTMLFRSTVATLGVLFGVTVLGGFFIAAIGADGSERWQPQYNVAAVVTNHTTYYTSPPDECFTDDGFYDEDNDACNTEQVLDAVDGGLYLGVVLLALGGVSVWSFRRRDVP